MKKQILAGILAISLIWGPSINLAGHDEIEDIYSKYGGPRLYRYYHPMSSDRHQVEDVFNRHGGPPLYRYYDKLPPHGPYHNHQRRTSYESDANYYWGSRYYGNENPNPSYEYWLDREIMELEGQY